ncbi:peptidoglycan DD-metalloendopeptidase family protein [Lysobacter sp. 5GHs7-4]|uniref:peptidoglycan DD-metalloendopeptidase family protein n=1 Tax=Lysobacter sp. 5GHs7-4 TaxID=2904253 RepID=UPI001E406085|nr:peptidoglycan DD-metalloendopeptidase family protein [Lysobacter sp. 5GHs7-4]UHQ24571.1 peptidoglycan DD-metalloendopeptidase family protein [Lysobacter sp. 5GHs7-4]
MIDTGRRPKGTIKTSTITTGTILVALAGALALAACSSTVTREPTRGSRTPVRVSTPKYGASAVVQRGDTMYGIAFRNGIDARDLAAWNGISAPYTIYPGQRLKLYPGGGNASAARPPVSRPVPGRPTTVTPATGAPTAPVARPPVATAPTRPPPAPSAPVSSGIDWRWPADGQLLSRYVAGEPTKQGIDIAGSSGAPVRAASDGVVVYSGSGLVGYGELIIIKHNDAWLSAYGHNRNRLVNEGQLVKSGQQIAEMGRSGAAREMLHFEVRYNGKPVDPLLYLPKK